MAAVLCNCNSTLAVEEWCRAHQALIRQVFGPLRHVTSSGSLYRRLLPRLSVEHLEWALAGWRQATRPVADREAVAIDGKTVCGAGDASHPAPHLLTVYTHTTQEVLAQVLVSPGEREDQRDSRGASPAAAAPGA